MLRTHSDERGSVMRLNDLSTCLPTSRRPLAVSHPGGPPMARSLLVFVLAAAHLTAAARAEGRKKPEPANPPVPPGVLFERNLEYSSPAKGLSLTLDVARPARAKKPCPTVVLIPGGTWLGGGRGGARALHSAPGPRACAARFRECRQTPP